MAETLRLPRADGTLTSYHLAGATPVTSPAGPIRSRIAYAAVHVVADPLAAINPTLEAALDWDATLAYRRYIWSLGLAVAEAMDTSQRGMGFDWGTARELIRRAVAEARGIPGARIASGAGTDHLEPGQRVTLADVEAAYEEQCAFIESVGGRIILMASRALAAGAKGGDDYVKVYGRILAQVREPVIIHWLGDMFDPALAGYWGSHDLDRATETLLAIVGEYAPKIDGVKISLLDQAREIAMRRRFPRSVRMYTGDDFDDPRRRRAVERRAPRDLRRDRPGRVRCASCPGRRRPHPLRRDPGADPSALAPRFRRAHALLQDRRRVRRVPQRPPVALQDGGRNGERTLGGPPRRAVRSDGPGGPPAGPRPRRPPHAPGASRRRRRVAPVRTAGSVRLAFADILVAPKPARS